MFADRYKFSVGMGPFNSDGDETRGVAKAEGTIEITDAYLLNTAAVATHATNYITFTLVNLGTDATGTTVIATASTSQTGGAAIAAHIPYPLTITAANATVTDGSVIGLVRDEQNTNASAVAACSVVMHYRQIKASD